jgi:endonuclease/exonuclease/phosphatase family metal-dependent hydrolase
MPPCTATQILDADQHGFRGADNDGSSGKIDWIFARGAVEPTASQIIREEQNGHYMSDHDFVWADVKLNAAE